MRPGSPAIWAVLANVLLFVLLLLPASSCIDQLASSRVTLGVVLAVLYCLPDLDAAEDMACRAPSNTVTCSGTPTGAAMTYDAERRLATWQNTPSNPTSTAAYWYDGEGHRVAQTYNGTTTYYLGDDEEITGSTLLKYYHIPGLPVLGTISGVTRTYLASDGLGSETVDLSYNGSVLATALYGPYGVGRYATGTMPSSRGYTGQRQDSGSGLDYYNARYYDGTIGQFTSPDTVQGPNRYGYVGGNPETLVDPSGHCLESGSCGSGGIDDGNLLAEDFETCRPYCGSHFIDPNYLDFFELEPGIEGEVADTTTTTEITITEDGQAETYDTTGTDNAADPTDAGARPGRPAEPTSTTSTDDTTDTGKGSTGGNGGNGGNGSGGGPGLHWYPPRPTSAEIRAGAQQALDNLPDIYGNAPVDFPLDTYEWTFQENNTVPDVTSNPAYGSYIYRYYLEFDDGSGHLVRISGQFDPWARTWEEGGWHFSSKQPSKYWRDIYRELDQAGWGGTIR